MRPERQPRAQSHRVMTATEGVWVYFVGIGSPVFLGSKVTAHSDCRHEIKRCLLLGRKVITILESILKSRDVTLPTKVCLVKAMVFPVVMYACESGL